MSDNDSAAAHWRNPAIAPPIRGPIKLTRRDGVAAPAPPVLVVGGSGGAGVTTTVLGLCGAMAGAGQRPVAVDATGCGGDLALRGADRQYAPATLQNWLEVATIEGVYSPPELALSQASSGAGILAASPDPLPRRTTLVTAARLLAASGFVPVFDGGGSIRARQLRPLLDEGLRLVLVIPARLDAANRLRSTLAWLDDEYGELAIAATTLVVSHQLPKAPAVGPGLKEHLKGWVRDITEIGFDRHLAHGLSITHAQLRPDTQATYAELLKGVWA